MSITTTKIARAAGLCAAAAGLLFLAVQVNHPHLDAVFATTPEYLLRQGAKLAMSVLALIGITGMYLVQTRKMGVLGLLGYLLFGACYLIMMSVEAIGAVVLPVLAHDAPGYVNDVFAAATGGSATGGIGLMMALTLASAGTYIAGGTIFGIALFRAGLLARWAAALLAAGTAATIAIPLLPMVNERLFAVPTGVALLGLGFSLWRVQRTAGDGDLGLSTASAPAKRGAK
ncbi:hypothetical protein GCM10009715_11020 [Paeniglutamicibacter psychrophenolicus]|uniref:DUF4386 family protein n=1 Tax=Paeniglutamicibacter psychrophenolicus TaxID=257454 RepID=A0ABS4WGZ9_9MICC|nr:hypothetical protein [Paeniglutamicibacter psychrophenolicus]MBP2375203.1 hypothetical protein [Paeniglutamicibacter psychrophenolicus]